MGRPSLPLGTAGKFRFDHESNGQWTARCSYRDYDGKVRPMERTRDTKSAAERALKEAVRDRSKSAGGSDLTADVKVAVLAEEWWQHFERSDASPTTKRLYRGRVDAQILRGVGELRVRELTTGASERFLRAVEDHHGAAVAKTTRSVLSGICAYAARHDLLGSNPVRETSAISVRPKKGLPRAFTLAEALQLRSWVTYDAKAIRRDIVDLIDLMLATGARIGEALACEREAIDLDAGTMEIRGTVIRLKGQGLIIKPEPKTVAGYRTLEMPSWCTRKLHTRLETLTHPTLMFPSSVGTLRDPANVDDMLKDAFTAAGFVWATSHSLRKTVATEMDKAGRSAREIADQLGHAKVSLTQDVYMSRRTRSTGANQVLEQLAH